jgi:DNA repair photolyase
MSIIYQPRGRAREYAALACNIYRGCDHRCIYCYAPNATYQSAGAFGKPEPRKRFFEQLERDAAKHANSQERVLLCFTCDPYQMLDTELQYTRQTIETLHRYGIPIQILTKGGSRALRDRALLTERDAFATTLTLLDDAQSIKWEPGAAPPSDRIETIKKFHWVGIPTWVSLEPVLNPLVSLELIQRTHEFVNLYKVGKLNYHPLAQEIDWAQFAHNVVELLNQLGKPYYIKDDLAAYLTAAERARLPEQAPKPEQIKQLELAL